MASFSRLDNLFPTAVSDGLRVEAGVVSAACQLRFVEFGIRRLRILSRQTEVYATWQGNCSIRGLRGTTNIR